MIKAVMFLHKNRYVGYYITGHAGFSEYNKDIVCSAVSALTQTVLIGLTEKLKIKTDSSIFEEGTMFVLVDVNSSEMLLDKADLLIGTLAMGLKNIEANYNKFLSVSERKVAEKC